MSRSLDRDRQRTLVLGAGAELAPRLDLASLGDVSPQARGILVIDFPDVVDAESADLAPPAEATTTAPAGSASGAARATSATRTASSPGTVIAPRTLALCAATESGPRRFAIRATPAVSLASLPGFVITHFVLMFLVLLIDVRSCGKTSVLKWRFAIVPGDFFDRPRLVILVRSAL